MIWTIDSNTLKKRKDSVLSSFLSTIKELEQIEDEASAEISKQEQKKIEIENEISELSILSKSVSEIRSNFKKIINVNYKDSNENTKKN